MDMYTEKNVKEGTRQQRGSEPELRDQVLTLQRKMTQGEEWQHFLRNGYNKNNSISIIVEFVKSPESKEYRKYVILHYFFNLLPRGFLLFLSEREQHVSLWCSLLCEKSRKPL